MPRLFAVIPAAGHSRRMGQPKLLLPYQGTTVIGRVLSVLAHPQIAARCLVARRDDAALKAEAERHHAWVVQPDVAPPDMRASVEFALSQIAAHFQPQPDDGWLLVPADHPLLSADLLQKLLTVWDRDKPQILVPAHRGKRGHPTFFRWSTVELIASLPADRGLNQLLTNQPDQVLEWPCDFPNVTQDLDTPEDYRRLLNS